MKAIKECDVTELGDPNLRDVEVNSKDHVYVDLDFFLLFGLMLFQTRLHNLPKQHRQAI